MKKIFLIAAIAVCMAICGTALAVTYISADDATGTATADKCFILDLDGCSADTNITLAAGPGVIYKIGCGVTASATPGATGTLTIAMAADTGKNLTGVKVALYTDSACKIAATRDVDGTETQYEQIGAGTITVTGIAESTDYWAKITYTGANNASALGNVAGTMTINFVVVED